ncbi:FHA domain-containing protein [Candidatus Uabimicrobium amorphum]|uniref:Forkhead-associated protein n=1 Tax=Uabimicrobium amorphum TaxID=2596890 RepID=A0A5S9F475_UABAM|nr:FHA domain-containing protein [Candidatus Uabimicrobium amorphum]BBM85232.1 forkhead-associated protein [Candidatus Uabimicrobium amorphum]
MTTDENVNYNARIIVEGGIKVLYKGVWVSEVRFDQDEISLGVMDPEHDIYPDINLRQYRLDGGDPYISRRHAKFIHEDGKYFVQDICNNNSTSIQEKVKVINNETVELHHGDRIFLSESLVFRFELVPDNVTEEPDDVVENEEEKQNTEYYLEVESQTPLYFKARNAFTHILDLNPQEWEKDDKDIPTVSVGRRSTEENIYPDIDLWKFYFNEKDEYIARKHARLTFEDDKFHFYDVSGKGSTWLNVKDDEHRLLKSESGKEKKELQVGDKLIISDSVVFIFKKYGENNDS